MLNVINKNKANIAFVVGNGINRYNSTASGNSWDELLMELWNKHADFSLKTKVPTGISLTEFYDVLELKYIDISRTANLQEKFCDLLRSWRALEHHRKFVMWAIENKAPILTTNFENTLGKSANCKLFRNSRRKFTDYYPWESYYGLKELSSPGDDFGIWHINGMEHYHRSIRLGLTHYMGSVERSRNWLHKGNDRRLFSGKNQELWQGSDSWLHIIFNKPIFIFGLRLEQNEVFLRWLLIKRAKYFSKFPDRKKAAWYAYTEKRIASGKKLFLQSLGIKPVKVQNYKELYLNAWN